jgi:hypothetical protein
MTAWIDRIVLSIAVCRIAGHANCKDNAANAVLTLLDAERVTVAMLP